jgi:hypothetical protein
LEEGTTITHRFEIRLVGAEARGARLEAGLLRDLLDLFSEGSQGALRLRVEGRSQAPGPRPPWLESAARLDFVGLGAGSTTLTLESPAVSEGAPDFFAQRQLFHTFDPDLSALHLLAESLEQALAGQSDSEVYDQALLQQLSSLAKILDSRLTRLEVRSNGRCQTAVDASRLAKVERLLRATPPSQRVRIAGRLDTIRHSDRMFVLLLEDGSTVKGVAEGLAPRQLAERFGKVTLIDGLAVFRPSGHLLRVEAETVEAATDAELELWSQVPRPTFGPLDEATLTQPQGPRSGINAVIGQWPGDESEEEFLAALAEMS